MKNVYIGIDCGSVSVKSVVINENKEIIKSYYTKNRGLIPSIVKCLSNIKIEDINVEGVGCTGTGREFVSILVGCDVVESEIISHYISATTIYKDVKTLIDIGGEDSKLMIIDNGKLSSFLMNNSCGGGCGAFLEVIANRLGIQLEEIGETALKSEIKLSIPSKCGVFAQSDVVSKLNKGFKKEDIMMGVVKGMCGNYFTMLAKGKNLKPPYVFQGATALNSALVKCMEDELRHKVIVPENPEFMGAFGVALLAKEEFKGKTNFKGFDIKDLSFTTKTYYACGCTNECEITEIYQNNEKTGSIGNRCNKCLR